jgi:glucan phosphoethanolaminetransferase (alkaline phosphatase superfamily)
MSIAEIAKFTGSDAPQRGGDIWLIFLLAVLVPLLSLAVIFLYKKRNIQILLAKILIFLIIAFTGASLVYSWLIISKYDAAFDSWYKLFIPVIQLILSILAYRGVKKDDDLVKSYDRLR